MTTTDAEAIARIVSPDSWKIRDRHVAGANDDPGLTETERANALASAECYVQESLRRANAILSYLASRREAQEPVAWRDVERKFYHSDWPLTKLLEARNGGLLTDEGEAWTYVFSHKDGIGGEYDLLRRREPAPPSPAPAGEVERLREALAEACAWHEAQDKALSKSGRADADYYWRRAQHREQVEAIDAALNGGRDE